MAESAKFYVPSSAKTIILVVDGHEVTFDIEVRLLPMYLFHYCLSIFS